MNSQRDLKRGAELGGQRTASDAAEKQNAASVLLTDEILETVLGCVHWGDEGAMESPPLRHREWLRDHSHHHGYSEFFICLSGMHTYGVDGTVRRLVPGSAVFLCNGLPHDESYSGFHGECIDLWMHFLPQGSVILNLIFNTRGEGQYSVPILCPPELREVFSVASAFVAGVELRSMVPPKVRKFLLYVACEIVEVLMNVDLAEQAVNERSVIEDIKLYAARNLTDRLTLTDLAKSAGYSPFHFHRMFLEAEGITPRVFVEGQRLKCACALLKNGHSVTSAALDSGFGSSAQFARVFRKQFQLTPTEWLQSIS